MTKAELIKAISEDTELTQVDANKFYKSLEANIHKALGNGDDEIKLGFATMKVTHRDAYTGHNPTTLEPMEIEAKNVVRVSASAPTKRSVAQ